MCPGAMLAAHQGEDGEISLPLAESSRSSSAGNPSLPGTRYSTVFRDE